MFARVVVVNKGKKIEEQRISESCCDRLITVKEKENRGTKEQKNKRKHSSSATKEQKKALVI